MDTVKRPVIDLLHVEGCPHYPAALVLIERVKADLGVQAELRITLITDQQAAEQHRFPGSPTIRVDGRDVEPAADPPGDYALSCRLYRHEHGLAGQPQRSAARPSACGTSGRSSPGAAAGGAARR